MPSPNLTDAFVEMIPATSMKPALKERSVGIVKGSGLCSRGEPEKTRDGKIPSRSVAYVVLQRSVTRDRCAILHRLLLMFAGTLR